MNAHGLGLMTSVAPGRVLAYGLPVICGSGSLRSPAPTRFKIKIKKKGELEENDFSSYLMANLMAIYLVLALADRSLAGAALK